MQRKTLDVSRWRSALALLLALGCSGSPPKTAASGNARPNDDAIDLTGPSAKQPASAWPPGLIPCPKDAPAGEGCSAPSAAKHGAPAHPGEADATIWKVPVGPDDPMRGPRGALVTVVEFSDFECPFCKREASVMKELLSDYPNDVRLVWKDCPLPMHPHAEAAAELARAARASQGDPGFWKVHDALYDAPGELGDALFQTISKDVGLRWEKVSVDIRAARYGEKIRANVALSDRVDVPATPTVFVNGRKLVGAQPYEKLRALVDEERDKARKSAAASAPISRAANGANGAGGNTFYDSLISVGKEVEPPTDLPPAPPLNAAPK